MEKETISFMYHHDTEDIKYAEFPEPSTKDEWKCKIYAILLVSLQEKLYKEADFKDSIVREKMIKKIDKLFHDRCKLDMDKIVKFCAKYQIEIRFI